MKVRPFTTFVLMMALALLAIVGAAAQESKQPDLPWSVPTPISESRLEKVIMPRVGGGRTTEAG
jgi:hypothetical protein